MTIEQLVDILQFKIEVMSQTPVVSTLLAGVATSGAIFLVSGGERSRLRATLLFLFVVSALCFVFATVLDASIMPAMKRNATLRDEAQIRGLLRLSSIVVYAIILGLAALVASLGAMGFLYSRRVGVSILAAAAVLGAGFVGCLVFLDRVVR